MDLTQKPQSLLTFRVGPVLFCAPSLSVSNIITPPKLTRPPGSTDIQPGIFRQKSHLVKVIDLRVKFSIDNEQRNQKGNLIVTHIEGGNFAFWIDQILDVIDFPTKGWGRLPSGIPRDIFTQTLLLNEKLHLYVDFENLTSTEQLSYFRQYIQSLQAKEKPKEIIKPTIEKKSAPITPQENKVTSIQTEEKEKVISPPIKVEPAALRSKEPAQTKTAFNINKTQTLQNKQEKSRPQRILKTSDIKTKITPSIKDKSNNRGAPTVKSLTADNTASPSTQNTSSKTAFVSFIIAILLATSVGIYFLFSKTTAPITSPSRFTASKTTHLSVDKNLVEDNKKDDVEIIETHKNKIVEPVEPVEPGLKSHLSEETQHALKAEIKETKQETTITIYEATPRQEESIVHIVVKGDTLWAITKKYIHNPFRYPELAKLNKISNPHRIYPGNRVQIRFVKTPPNQ